MEVALNSIIAVVALLISVMALVVTIYYNHKSNAINVAKDKPVIRTHIIKYTGVSFPWTVLYVRNVGVGVAYNVVIVIGGKECKSFDLDVKDFKSIPVTLTDGLIINSLTYTDIHNKKHHVSDFIPEIIMEDSGFL